MKAFCYILLLIVAPYNHCFPQDSKDSVFYLNRLPSTGVLLDKGWKFHAGDDPAWADPNLDDRYWQAINPADDIHELIQLRESQIGWFRLHLRIDTAEFNQPMAFLICQTGASEFYLNGQRILRLGNVSTESKREVVYNPNNTPYLFQFSKSKDQVLAVRYSFTRGNLYFNSEVPGNKTLLVQLFRAADAYQVSFSSKVHDITLRFARIGFLLLLFLIHLFFYLHFPENRTNLYYSLFALCWMLANWLLHPAINLPLRGNESLLLKLLIQLFEWPALFFALTAVYSHVHQAKGKMYWFVFLCMLLAYPAVHWPYRWGWLMIWFYFVVLVVDAIRVSGLAIRRNVSGAKIILTGWVVFFLSTSLPFLRLMGFIRAADLGPHATLIFDVGYNAGFLFLWLPFSIILSREFATTSRALKERLIDLEKLSKEKLELEKQKRAVQIEAMVATQEQERKRISRDLHDEVGTKLTALNLMLSSLGEKAKCTRNSEIRTLLTSSSRFVNETIDDVRRLLHDLSPTVLEEFGYVTAVEGLINKMNATSKTHFDLLVFGMNNRLGNDYELALYRMTQELINNVLKHAGAKNASLQIGQRDGKIILMVEDDGRGFDLQAHKDGYGLKNLQARTKLMQGVLVVDSKPNKGTSVMIEIPYCYNSEI